ncbi:MAG: LysR family transcriptional regulator [Stackebrandtia sp.]
MIDHRLQTLRALCAHGTVTSAAYAMHLTPSTVSQQLRQLAKDVGAPLLEADGRRVRLTPAAHILLEHADVLHAQWERARCDLEAYRQGDVGELRLCGISSAVAALAAPAAALLRDSHPRLKVHMSAEESAECFRLLLAEAVDIAVVIPGADAPSLDDPRFEQELLTDDPQDLLVPADHRWAGKESVELSEAAHEAWISMPNCLDAQQMLFSSTARAGFVPRVEHEAADPFSLSGLVSCGFGVGLMPHMWPVPADHRVVRVPISGEVQPTRRIFACVRRGSADQGAIAHALKALRTVSQG